MNRVPEAIMEVVAEYDSRIISAISWMEVACQLTPQQIAHFRLQLLMADIDVVQTTEAIMISAAAIRKHSLATNTKKVLPDCIIRATAEVEGRVIITRNAKDFGGPGPFVRVPYDMVGGKVFNIRPPLV